MLSDTLTTQQQKLLMLVYDSGFITKKEQEIYRSRFFYNRVGQLIHKKLINAKKDYTHNCNQYTLTERGIIIVKILRGEVL